MQFIVAPLCFLLSFSLIQTAQAGPLLPETVEAIVSILNGRAPEKKTRTKTKDVSPQIKMGRSLRSVLSLGDLNGNVLDEVIQCALQAHFGLSYEGAGCRKNELFVQIQNQILRSAESTQGRSRRVAKKQLTQVAPLSPRVIIQTEPVVPLFVQVAPRLAPSVNAERNTPVRAVSAAGRTRNQKRIHQENDVNPAGEWGKQIKLDEPVGEDGAFVIRTPRFREEPAERDGSTPRKRKGRSERIPELHQAKIPLFFDNLSPLKFKVNHLEDHADRLALAEALEVEWQDNVRQKREFLEKLQERFGVAPITPETAKAVLTSLKVAQNPKLADTLEDVDLDFAKRLGAFPDFSARKDESVTGSFSRRTKKAGDPGAYFTTYGTTFRYAYEQRGLPAETPIALKVMEPQKWTEVLNLKRKNLFQGVDRSTVAMILLNGRTDYIPELYGLSFGWRVGEETSRKLLWTEVEWIPETVDKVLAEGALIPESVVLQVLYDEVQLRKLGICIADWKGQNVGFVNTSNPRTLTIAGQDLILPPGRRLKRMDPGEIHFVQPRVGRPEEFEVPRDCFIDLEGWKTSSEALNQALPGYVEQLNLGDTRFLYSADFLRHFHKSLTN